MAEKWLYLAVAIVLSVVCFAMVEHKKSEDKLTTKALSLGYQECKAMDSRGNTIVLLQKECSNQ